MQCGRGSEFRNLLRVTNGFAGSLREYIVHDSFWV